MDRSPIFGDPQFSNARIELRRDENGKPFFFYHGGWFGKWQDDWKKAVKLTIFLHADGDYHVEGHERFGSDDTFTKWLEENGEDANYPVDWPDDWFDTESCEEYKFRAVFVGEAVDRAIIGYLLDLMYHIREREGITGFRTAETIVQLSNLISVLGQGELEVGREESTPIGMWYDEGIDDGNQHGNITLEVVENTYLTQ